MMHKGIHYITGMGQISNLGSNIAECIQALTNPDDSMLMKRSQYCSNKELSFYEHIDENVQGISLLENKMLYKASQDALLQAGLDSLEHKRVGIVIGTTSACTISNSTFINDYYKNDDQYSDMSHYRVSKTQNPAMILSKTIQSQGPILTLNNACTSGTDAIGVGKMWLDDDRCDLVICGGVDRILENMMFGFSSLKLLSDEFAMPFDINRKGLVLSEGCGVVVLENGEQIRKEDRPTIASVVGYGICGDAYHATSPHPDARGLKHAVETALYEGRLNKEDIDTINAHGTGTLTNDLVEGKFLKKHLPDSVVFATKGYTGHTLAAAGAIEAIISAISLQQHIVPKTLGFESQDPAMELFPTKEVLNKKSKYIMSTSLGFGGTSSALILGRGYE